MQISVWISIIGFFWCHIGYRDMSKTHIGTPLLTNVLLCVHLSLLTTKGVDLVVSRDDFLCVMESLNIRIFHIGYFDNRGVF